MAFARGPSQTDSPDSLQRSKLLAGRKPCPPGVSRLESENNSSRRMRGMRPAISAEGLDAKVRIFIDIAPVLGAYRPMSGERVVDPPAVKKSSFRLGISAIRIAARVAGSMKPQAATSAEN